MIGAITRKAKGYSLIYYGTQFAVIGNGHIFHLFPGPDEKPYSLVFCINL